jgi:MOSC domain-containing protein YiiM
VRLLSVNTGRLQPLQIQGRRIQTAIGKQPVPGPVQVGRMGLDGDEQADPSVHGGLAKAVYAYPSEHLPFWQTVRAQARAALWEEPLDAGLFGTNLLLQGLRETELWVGDRLRLPDCTLVVSEPRRPCGKFEAAMGFGQASKLMFQSGFCGSYLAVLQPGTVSAGEIFTLEPGPRDVNIRDLFKSRAVRD